MPLKVTSWNVEHARKLIDAPTATDKKRREAVRKTLDAIDPDIFCFIEGPKGEKDAIAFSENVLDGQWVPVLLDGGMPAGSRDKDYAIRGTQWIWFFAKPDIAGRCSLKNPAVWQGLTGRKTWSVHLWGVRDKVKKHYHYRHPQVLVYTFPDGQEMELIGVHLKSKIMVKNREAKFDSDKNITNPYLDEALENRIKLATEALDVRRYIGRRFADGARPAMMIMGDCNDGPGQDWFEERYLFFDLVSNLEGSVLESAEYFNHALFDFPDELRWTARYDDAITGKKAKDNPLLLDHIMMSQPLCDGSYPLAANGSAGKVEHDAYDEGNAGLAKKYYSSDHRPVSIVLQET